MICFPPLPRPRPLPLPRSVGIGGGALGSGGGAAWAEGPPLPRPLPGPPLPLPLPRGPGGPPLPPRPTGPPLPSPRCCIIPLPALLAWPAWPRRTRAFAGSSWIAPGDWGGGGRCSAWAVAGAAATGAQLELERLRSLNPARALLRRLREEAACVVAVWKPVLRHSFSSASLGESRDAVANASASLSIAPTGVH